MPLSHELPLDEVNLISSWVESMLFGMHCILFGFCIHTLWHRRKTRSSRNLIVVSTAMLSLAFTHVALSLRGLLEGFIWHFAGHNVPVATYYANFAAPLYCAKDTIYVANSFLADGLMLWRVWVVWGYDWKAAVVPALLYAGSIVTGIRAMVVLWEIQQNSTIFVITLVEWISAFWALSLAVNILCTSMICFRIARNSVNTRAYRDVITVIVESGALYTISVALHMTMYDIKSNTGQITGDIATQLSVICPTLIIVRVGARMGREHNGSSRRVTSFSPSSTLTPPHAQHARHPSRQEDSFLICMEQTTEAQVSPAAHEKSGSFASGGGDEC